MKTNSHKTNKIWMGAAIGFALLLLFAAPQRAVAQWTASGNNISNTNTGNVGVGTASPGRLLTVNGDAGITTLYGNSTSQNANDSLKLGPGSNGNFFIDNTGAGGFAQTIFGFNTTKTAGGNGVFSVFNNSTDRNLLFMAQSAGTGSGGNQVTFPTGYVGIGTTAPIAPLHIGPNYDPTVFNQHFGALLMPNLAGGGGGSSGYGAYDRALQIIPTQTAAANGNSVVLYMYPTIATGVTQTNQYGLYVDNALGSGTATHYYPGVFMGGNVGIGTASPGYKLDVAGTINATAMNISGSPIAGSVFGRTGAVVAATNDYTWAQINKTTSSLGDLATRACANLSNAAAFCSSTDAANLTGTLPDGRFPATLPPASGTNLTALNANSLASGTVGTARLGSGTADNTTFLRGDNTWAVPSGATQWTTTGSNINYAASGGNVGVGQANPAYKLDVNGTAHVSGNMTVDGNLAAKYQDVAEWVPSSEQLPTGTVVVLDSTKSNQVISSVQAYDTRVAGVVSEQPGIALGERGSNKVLVATTGRVKVKVDATRGPIQVGDLLVTSDIPGMAMKSEPVNIGGIQLHRPGTLIGKALEPLAKGQGEILVLLSLQ